MRSVTEKPKAMEALAKVIAKLIPRLAVERESPTPPPLPNLRRAPKARQSKRARRK
jgi:hypothetical protein